MTPQGSPMSQTAVSTFMAYLGNQGFGANTDWFIEIEPSGWDYDVYDNYIDDRLSNWQQIYYGAHYPCLESLKATYDPRNMFKFPMSVEE
ncbi:hypothetical protein BJ165DRAFT_1458951 [Panaeolus papilionaceus]|nr:hypothetical protein BJ165DRAFT_1458951 [Panaeolus papilionaceus]